MDEKNRAKGLKKGKGGDGDMERRCGSQSRKTMEVEDYSAKSESYGAFERRRETSTMEVLRMKEMREIKAMMTGMMMNQNRSTTGGMRMNQNQSTRVQGASETTGRVEYFFG